MERIKLAISKAKEVADQKRLLPDGSPALAAADMDAPAGHWAGADHRDNKNTQAASKRWTWAVRALLLAGLVAVMAYFWAGWSAPGAEPKPVALQAEPVSAPPRVTAAQSLPVESTVSAEIRNETPVGANVPAAGTAAVQNAEATTKPIDQIVAAVETWRQSWARRDMVRYLDAYSKAFTPPGGLSRDDWVASRYRNVGGRTSIEVQISRLQVALDEPSRARVSFLQDYTSGGYRELGRPKTLDMVRDADGRWRIVDERQ